MHAALLLTVPFALIPSKPTTAELIYLLKKLQSGASRVKLRLFTHSSLYEQALNAVKQVNLQIDCIYLLDTGADLKAANISSLVENVNLNRIPRQPVVPAKKETVAYLLFSSGTSGPPKGASLTKMLLTEFKANACVLEPAVMISHGNLCFTTVQTITGKIEDMRYIPVRLR